MKQEPTARAQEKRAEEIWEKFYGDEAMRKVNNYLEYLQKKGATKKEIHDVKVKYHSEYEDALHDAGLEDFRRDDPLPYNYEIKIGVKDCPREYIIIKKSEVLDFPERKEELLKELSKL